MTDPFKVYLLFFHKFKKVETVLHCKETLCLYQATSVGGECHSEGGATTNSRKHPLKVTVNIMLRSKSRTTVLAIDSFILLSSSELKGVWSESICLQMLTNNLSTTVQNSCV